MKLVTESFVFLLFLYVLCCVETYPLVRTSQGLLSGTIQESLNGRPYSTFLGIPFAKPPVGKLRFKSPVPGDKWEGIRPATEFGKSCLQYLYGKVMGDEDCLYLNAYSPHLKFGSAVQKSKLLPVMVFIHGGAFFIGSADEYRANYLLDKDIVLVTFNYRLGIFGFFTTGDSAAPGNFGMKDQVLALKWVRENIREFGGDPDQVTLFGEGAGGSSVSFHTLSDSSTGLFQQYILQSGTALSPLSYQDRSKVIDYSKTLTSSVACPTISSRTLVNCMRKKDAKTLVRRDNRLNLASRFMQITWTPTVEPESEDAFLTDSPMNLINNGRIKDLPFMTGTVSEEGLLVTRQLYMTDLYYRIAKAYLRQAIAFLTNYYFVFNNNIALPNAAKNFYFNRWYTRSEKYEFLENCTKFASDGFFIYPEVALLEKVMPQLSSPVYYYAFDYRGFSDNRDYDEGIRGIIHGEDNFYLFPITSDNYPVQKLNWTTSDKLMRDLMVDLWTSFAISGKPTSQLLDEPDLWEPFQNENQLQIGGIYDRKDTTVKRLQCCNNERMNFWRQNAPL